MNYPFHTPSAGDLFYTERAHLRSSAQLNLTNSTIPFHILTRAQPTTFEYADFDFFSFFAHLLCSVFDFSKNITSTSYRLVEKCPF